MEWIYHFMLGFEEGFNPSCFIDAEDLHEASNENRLSINNPERDYTKFGPMKKIIFDHD